MSKVLEIKKKRRLGRKGRIRAKIGGTAQRPRVSVFFSNRNVFAQLIDDASGRTMAFVSTMDKDASARGKNKAAARWAGSALAEKALALGVKAAVFDRSGYLYHGRVKELADAIREKGILM